MKKLLFISALVLGFAVSANAQTEKTTKTTTETTTTKQYKPIDRNTVAPSALEKIGTKYGGYSILEAYQATDGEYKLVVSKDNKKSTAYFTSTGEFLKEE
ncbi:hypothetical protein HUK80_07525 [Flavobacterium sp. MAH-1]|uniref:Beta-lactamase-inhibitor-like PepSY-like domain-containing protein n=1 Tax=Flavobacterium agri TaxID=2743471 RepID=A0A7Y8Y3R8_9FLAO|nr:hypothetical protein [Flavobacterium agri]NUY80736.1 hypothetical protein [Flavobacterium agri]NYA70760.1 hypothetical protein [Flavobacterium agri]